MSRKFSSTVLDTLLKTVEVEFRVPLFGFGEIKFPVSEYAKEWWKNEKAREDLLNAIVAAEQKFGAQLPDNKAAQLLKEFSLKNEEEFQRVIAELLNHLNEQKITWLMADKLGKGFEKILSNKELQDALNAYIPYLRDELCRIRGFREVITYLLQKQIANTTSLTYETAQEIKDLLLEQRAPKTENQPVFIPEVFTESDKLSEQSDFLPPGSRMPFYRNKIFTGREYDLIALAKFLLSTSDMGNLLQDMGDLDNAKSFMNVRCSLRKNFSVNPILLLQNVSIILLLNISIWTTYISPMTLQIVRN